MRQPPIITRTMQQQHRIGTCHRTLCGDAPTIQLAGGQSLLQPLTMCHVPRATVASAAAQYLTHLYFNDKHEGYLSIGRHGQRYHCTLYTVHLLLVMVAPDGPA
jgi:hypothetical protein